MKIKKHKLTLAMTLLVGVGFLIPGCEEKFSGGRYDSKDMMQAYDYILTRPDLSVYKEICDYTGFYGVISTAGTYTIFVPTNDAFDRLFKRLTQGGEVISGIRDKTPEYWLNYLEYLTVGKNLNTNAFELGMLSEPTLMGEDYYLVADIRGGYTKIKLNSLATITEANIKVANGLVNVIDEVLLPPTKSVYDMLVEAGTYKTMLQIFEDNGLTDYLKDSVVTLVVEPDYILEKYHFDRDAIPNEGDWADYHVINTERSFSGDLNGRTIKPMYKTESLTFNIDVEGQMWCNQKYAFSQTPGKGIDNVGSNGVFHALDTILTIEEATIGKRIHNLIGKTNEEAGVVQNVFADAPASINEDTGTSSFHRGQKPPICGFDAQQVGDIFYTTIPDVVSGKYTVRFLYKTGNRVNLMMIYNDEVISTDLIMDTKDGDWVTWTYMNRKDLGVIDVPARGDAKLYFQVIQLKRDPAACCDMLMDAIELIPVEE